MFNQQKHLENPPAIIREDREARFRYEMLSERIEHIRKHFILHAEGKCQCPLTSGDAAEAIGKPKPKKTKYADGLEISQA